MMNYFACALDDLQFLEKDFCSSARVMAVAILQLEVVQDAAITAIGGGSALTRKLYIYRRRDISERCIYTQRANKEKFAPAKRNAKICVCLSFEQWRH